MVPTRIFPCISFALLLYRVEATCGSVQRSQLWELIGKTNIQKMGYDVKDQSKLLANFMSRLLRGVDKEGAVEAILDVVTLSLKCESEVHGNVAQCLQHLKAICSPDIGEVKTLQSAVDYCAEAAPDDVFEAVLSSAVGRCLKADANMTLSKRISAASVSEKLVGLTTRMKNTLQPDCDLKPQLKIVVFSQNMQAALLLGWVRWSSLTD